LSLTVLAPYSDGEGSVVHNITNLPRFCGEWLLDPCCYSLPSFQGLTLV